MGARPLSLRISRPAACLVVGALVGGCAHAPLVERAYGGRVLDGRAIEAEAYASFLRGAMAEAAGDASGALEGYADAARRDSDAPEIWTRIGAVRCAADQRDPRADAAFGRAAGLEETYAGVWTARATCELARGDTTAAMAAAGRASVLDPSADGAKMLLARAGRPRLAGAPASDDAAAREALVALTATARDRVAAWDALAAWAQSRGDVALWAHAMTVLVTIAPARRDAALRAAETLAGAGEVSSARAVAAAAADADESPVGASHPLAARLALDEAIDLREGGADVARVRARATRVHVDLEEAASRAQLAGRTDIARDLASTLVRADPQSTGARLALAAVGATDLAGEWSDMRRGGEGWRAEGATVVAFGAVVVRALAPADARAVLTAIVSGRIIPGDDRVVRPAVELVARGVLESDALSLDGLVELALLVGKESPEGASRPPGASLDARHEYLSLALTQPQSPRAKELGAMLARVVLTDPVVASAAALIDLASGGPVDPASARTLLARVPPDPLLAATALRIAKRTGDAATVTKARATLTALSGSGPSGAL